MIKVYEEKNLDEVHEIWLKASVRSHDFIPSDFWESKLDEITGQHEFIMAFNP